MDREAKAELARKTREPKTRLIEIDGEFFRAGFHRESRALGAIIARLEAFERKHG